MTPRELYNVYRTVPSMTLDFDELSQAEKQAWGRVAIAVSRRLVLADPANRVVLEELAKRGD